MISIIIPIYNAENFLSKCIESILRQTYTDFELYLVDDGSTDNSGILCDEYALKDNRIKVLHCTNGGAAKAREKAREVCHGEYICFVDADDYISEDFLDKLYNDIARENADISCCRTMQIDGDKQSLCDRFTEYEIIADKGRFIKDYIDNKDLYNKVLWAKMFKRDLIDELHIKPLVFYEDTTFMYEAFLKAKKVILDPFVGYYYYRNDDSITRKNISKEKEALVSLDHIFAFEAVANLAKEADSTYSAIANREYANSIIAAISRMVKCKKKPLYFEKYDFVVYHINKVKGITGISPKYRILTESYKRFPKLFWLFYSFVVSGKE